MSLLVFIAAPFYEAEKADEIARKINALSCKAYVISRWHNYKTPLILQTAHITNMVDLKQANVVVALTFPGKGREMFIEIGMHLARRGKVFWLPTEPDGSFEKGLSLEQHPNVNRASNEKDLLELIRLSAMSF